MEIAGWLVENSGMDSFTVTKNQGEENEIWIEAEYELSDGKLNFYPDDEDAQEPTEDEYRQIKEYILEIWPMQQWDEDE